MEFTKEQIKNKYDLLPEDVKTAVSSVDTTDTLINIGEKYKLHVDKMGDLIDETTLVMIGLKPTNNFVNNVKKRLNISFELAENIVREVNEKILLKVRNSLRQIHEKSKDSIISLNTSEKKQNTIKPIINEQKNISNLKPSLENKDLNNSFIQPKAEEELKREDILKEIEEPLINNNEEEKISLDVNQTKEINQKGVTTNEPIIETNFATQDLPINEPYKVKKDIVQKPEKEFVSENLEENKQDLVSNELSIDVQKKPVIIEKKSVSIPTPTQTSSSDLNSTLPISTPDIVENKLTQVVKEPVVEEVVEDKKDLEQIKKPTIDPYREPIE